MRSILVVLVFFATCFSSITLSGQTQKEVKKLIRLLPKSSQLMEIMDSIIIHEYKCDYFDTNLYFSISVRTWDSVYYSIVFESGNQIYIPLTLNSYGYFYYNQYLFLVMGDTNDNLWDTTNEVKKFSYIDESKGKIIFPDDSFSLWGYWYVDGNFINDGRSTFCK